MRYPSAVNDGLVLAEFDGVAGVFDERRDVGADEHLAVADADHQRGGAAGGDDRARLVGVGEDQREVALQPAQHGKHGGDEVAAVSPCVVLRTTRCTATSVSVSLANSTPAASSSWRSAAKFSMIPLWTTAILPAASRCGWALRSVGLPWVAHRVWPIPVVEGSIGSAASSDRRFSSLPAFLRMAMAPPATTATPAESYPRYSRRFRPATTTSTA